MSTQEPVITVSNETPESERVDSPTVPPSEHPAVKDSPPIADSSPVEPVTELPVETAQSVSDDTLLILPKHETNIPNATPTSGSAGEAGATSFVDEQDHTPVSVEIRKGDDVGEGVEGKAPIKHGANGDVGGATSGGFEGADLDPADQTLVEGVSQDADTSAIQEFTGVPVKGLDVDAKKIVVEEDEGDKVPESVAVPVKDVEEVKVHDVAPVPEVTKSVAVPVEEETLAPANPEPVDAEPSVVEPVEVDTTSVDENVGPVAGHGDPYAPSLKADLRNDEPAPSEEPVVEEKGETGVVSAPAPPSDEPVVEPTESKPTEPVDDVPTATEDPSDSKPVIADLDAAKEVEPHAAELEVAPESIATVTVIKEDTEHVPEEPAKAEEPELEAVPTVEPKDETAPSVAESAPEPVVEEPVETSTSVDIEPKAEESLVAKDEVETVIEESEEITASVQDEVPQKAEDTDPTSEAAESEPAEKANLVTEERTIDELEVPPPESQEKVEEPVPVVAVPVEESESSSDVAEPEVSVTPAPEPTVEDDSAPVVLEPGLPTPEPALGDIPLVESESVTEPQEPEAIPPAVSSERFSTDEAEPEETVPTASESVEVLQDALTQERSKEIERSQSPWTPSYSVSSQGGGLDSAAPADEEAVEPTSASEPTMEEPVAESVPTPEIVDSIEEPAVTESVPAEPEDVPTVIQEAEPEPTVSEPVVEELAPRIVPSAEEPPTVEPEAASEGVSKSPSWTPSYSTTIQGSSPRLDSREIAKDDSEPVSSEPHITQHAEPILVPAESVTTAGVPEPTATEDDKPTDEVPSIDVPSEEPSEIFDPSSNQVRLAQPVEVETERPKSPWTPSYAVTTLPGSGSSPRVDPKPELDDAPAAEVEVDVAPVEKVEATETPKIVTPADEEPAEPAAATETPWAQSYSVTSQPGSPRISPKAELEELEPESQPIEPIQETSVAAPVVELSDVPRTVVTPVVEDESKEVAEPVAEEEPTWTQSYSVTSQPGSPRVSPKQVSEEIPEEEAKPSWTQSYSVISQPGSPRISPKEEIPEPTVESVVVADEPTTVVTPPVEEATPAPAEAEVPERPKSPWTPSYSVTTLEGHAEQAPPEDTEPEPEVSSIPKTFTEEVPGPAPEVEASVTDTPSEPLAADDEQPERPKSPWTPSYSVTTLSSTTPAEEPAPDSVVDEPSAPIPEPIEVTKAVEDHQKENGTTSDVFEVHEAIAQLAVHDEPHVDVKIPESAPLDLPKPDATAEDEGESSWTPSYSVTQLPGASLKVETKENLLISQDAPTVDEPATKEVESTSIPAPQEVPQHTWNPSYVTYTQGPATNGTTVDANKDDGPHYFPGVPESLDEAPERPKLDLLTSVDTSNVTKVSPRGRYASSTSSRLFPGAWFSSPRSPGDETRTSMEEATGEFILSRSSVPPNEPAVAEDPEDLPASPITPASPTTKKDKKWRACEIM